MRRRLKPIVAFIFLGIFAFGVVLAHLVTTQSRTRSLAEAEKDIPSSTLTTSSSTSSASSQEALKPIIDLSAWQAPDSIDYDTLAKNISAVIVRVQGGSNITKKNNATDADGMDTAYQKHITEFQKRGIPVAVYAYVLGSNKKEMRAEAKTFYKAASKYHPTYYWLDVEEKTMSDMDAGVQAFRKELASLGAKKIGIYIGTYFMQEHGISTSGFSAVWIPTYGTDNGYYNAAPATDLDYDLHQYTSQGRLNGYNGVLDLNQIAPTKDTQATFKKLFGS
ncbi:glycoside hydrolase family 25 protein [Streptococcus sp. DD12]|uniref:glycoside hydrolase family 25 protein n=1 Tax=Streptococcus sp. DD12 TaxID=1777880 RepID=UPI00079621D8|nr:glycoside hydrolase family 25 protein [Streptococcus sp. DD12]KXT76379.1 Phage lysin, glycosyl hydrolase, family 25 [Streptococcus sp. DD12]